MPHGVYAAKKHFDIVAGILAIEVGWADGFGESFRTVHEGLPAAGAIDCGFAAKGREL